MKRALIVFAVYLALALALTYPLVWHLSTVLPNDAGDPALNTWILWWNAHAVPYTAAWWNAPAFYPSPGALAFSEHLLGLSVIASPIQWAGGSPQLAYNITFILTFPLCAMGAYLLARDLTGRDDASFIAGLLFGFAPYRIAHLPQIQVLAAFAMPFALLGLHRYLRERQLRWLALFGAGWFMQAICNGYYMLFFALVIALWILWFGRTLRVALPVLAAWFVSSLPLLPLLWQYRSIHEGFGFVREFGTIRDFGADVAALLNTTSTLAVWGWVHAYRRGEGELFPGVTIVVLILAATVLELLQRRAQRGETQAANGRALTMIRRAMMALAVVTTAIYLTVLFGGPWRLRLFHRQLLSVSNPVKPLTYTLTLTIALALTAQPVRRAFATKSVLGFYAVTAFVAWLFSLGPAPSLFGSPLMYRGPYSLLMFLPGFNSLRVPARFWMMSTLCLAMIGAVVFGRLTARAGSWRRVAAVAVALGVLADGWVMKFPLAEAPPTWKVESCLKDGAVTELPLGRTENDVTAMYRSMSHRHPVVNGYSGYFPPLYTVLRFGLGLMDAEVLSQLASHGAPNVVVDKTADPTGDWGRFIEAYPRVEVVCSDERQTVFRLSPLLNLMKPPPNARPLKIATVHANVNEAELKYMTDGDRLTRWETGPQSDTVVMDIDLGDVKSVGAIETTLGPYVGDFPRVLSIQVLGSGAVWKEIFRGATAAAAFVGAIESPYEVPMTLAFPPVDARYIRLKLLSNDEKYYWSVAELKILGS